MTPKRARRLGIRWFIASLVALSLRLSLEVLGFDEFVLPLYGVSTICLMLSMRRLGWAEGYRDHAAEVRQ